jgi:aminopeptidase N
LTAAYRRPTGVGRLDAGRPLVDRRSVLRGFGALLGTAGTAGLLAGCGSGALGGVPATPIEAAASSLDPYFPGYGAGGFLVNHYALQLTLAADLSSFTGTATIQIMPYAALTGLSLDLRGPRALSARINGRSVAFSQPPGGKLHLAAPGGLQPGRNATLEIGYTARRTPATAAGVGRAGWLPAGSGASAGPAVSVLSLPVGASTWYPCVDHPSAKAAYDISVSAPARYSVLANGRLVGKSTHGDQKTWSYHHPGPMASYLASIQVGEFQLADGSQAQTKAPSDVLIRNAYPAAMAAAAEYDLGRQGQMISVFAKLFGAYPFDVYGSVVVDGLPTQGGSGALGVGAEDTAAEDPVRRAFAAQTLGLLDAGLIDGHRTNESQVANAVARQWFGAGVTVADWSDYWLSESFAKYGEWLWAEQTGGASAASAAQAAMARLRALPQDLIVSDPGAQRLLDVRLGLRGACYLQALRQSVGEQDFFQILQVWCNRAQAGTGTTADFVQIIPQVYTVYPLNQFNDSWLYSSVLPELP